MSAWSARPATTLLLLTGLTGCSAQLDDASQRVDCTPPGKVQHADWLQVQPVDGHLKVVAIGSSSTYGEGASDAAHSYPSQLQALLNEVPARAAGPFTSQVLNKGIGGEALDQLIARWDRDVYAQQPQLLILQTATVDSLQGKDPTRFATQLDTILTQTQAHAIPVLILNSQHFPNEPGTYKQFQQIVTDVALKHRLALIDRYRFTTDWVNQKIYGYPQLLAADNVHPNDFLHRCTAQVIAGVIEEAIQ